MRRNRTGSSVYKKRAIKPWNDKEKIKIISLGDRGDLKRHMPSDSKDVFSWKRRIKGVSENSPPQGQRVVWCSQELRDTSVHKALDFRGAAWVRNLLRSHPSWTSASRTTDNTFSTVWAVQCGCSFGAVLETNSEAIRWRKWIKQCLCVKVCMRSLDGKQRWILTLAPV